MRDARIIVCVCTVVGVKRRISTDSEYEDDDVVVKRVKVEPDSEEDSEVSGIRRIGTPARGRGRPPGKL